MAPESPWKGVVTPDKGQSFDATTLRNYYGEVAKLVDATGLNPVGYSVRVRIPPSPPNELRFYAGNERFTTVKEVMNDIE